MNAPGARTRSFRPVAPVRNTVSFPFVLAPLLACVAPAVAQTTAAPAASGSQPATAIESSVRELEARVEELDRRFGTSALLDLLARIDRLTKEVQELRDRTEIQSHEIGTLRTRQQDLYAELDRLAHRFVPPDPVGAGAPREEGEDPGRGAEPVAGPPSARMDSGSPGDEPGESGQRRPPAVPSDAASGASEPGRESSPPRYDPVEEQMQYQSAFDLLSEGQFERAANAFDEFLAAFPESRYQDTARFWKGECLYALRRFEPALEEFRGLVASHPDSPRIPGAKLKIGFILHEIGRSAEAAEELRALVEAAPDSSEAKLARDRLERLQ